LETHIHDESCSRVVFPDGGFKLYAFDEQKFNRLTRISKRIQELEKKWNAIKGKLKRL